MKISSYQIIRLNFKGGIIPPEKLRVISNEMNKFGIREAYLGNRQNIYFDTDKYYSDSITERLKHKNIDFETNKLSHPNIVSSYAAVDLFAPQSWLNESIFREVLDTFDYHPNLKINITDINQGLVTAFDCDISFIASDKVNFWYLYVKIRENNKFVCWPDLIYSTDLGAVAKALESQKISLRKIIDEDTFLSLKVHFKYISTEKDVKLKFPRYFLPNYEGIHRNGDRSWLGINMRGAGYSQDFLENLAILCIKTDVSSIYLTPWRNIIIKNINEKEIIKWEALLGKFGINIRHSSLELNWKSEDYDDKAEKLKRYIVKKLDKTDTRTYGLTFSIKESEDSELTSSIIIKRKYFLYFSEKLRLFPFYQIFRTEDFNPNNQKLLYEGSYFSKKMIVNLLRKLCNKYYKQLGYSIESTEKNLANINGLQMDERIIEQNGNKDAAALTVYECKHCFTVYDDKYGDVVNNVDPGVLFENLPADYSCSVCGGPKNDFRVVKRMLTKALEKN